MTPSDRPNIREKISYGFGDLASCLYWQTFSIYLLYFYTDVFGITAAAAGLMFLVSRIFDGINDPIMGMYADRTMTRWGKFRPFLLWLCVPFAVIGVFMFTTPNLSSVGKLIWAYLTYNLMMMTYTAINIPYTSLLGVISNDPRDRTQVSSIKFLFAFGAGTIVSASLLPLVKLLGAGNETRGWQLSFLVYGVAATAFFLVTFFGTRERVTPPEGQKTSVVRDLSDLFSNTPWLWLLFTTVAFILFVATRCSTTTYYFKYYVGTQNVQLPVVGGKWNFEALVSTFNTIGQVFSILGVLLVSSIANHFGKRRSFIVLYGVSLATTAAFYFLKPEQVGVMFVLQAVGSFAGSPLNALLWAMYADTADYGEWKNGRRATGLVFSASTMSQKFGWAIGAFVATKVMSVTGFQPNVTQTPESLHSLVLLVSLIPATVGLLAFIPLYFYQLDERKMKQITRELLERREQGAPTLASAQLPTAR